ncbi:enoyl-CoA hydratase-related protein [Nocardia sp. NPDC050697]|uniref:enoyl-CoA hydratase-related protein n=1 Tax=Nocardia sp. NPDC050697 TaxID=3155158 RepID=UPI0033CDF5F6
MSTNTPAEFTTLALPAQRGVAVLRFSRPPANLINLQLAREIAIEAERAGKHESVAALVLYGDERIFSAGDDLAEIGTWSPDQAVALASDHSRHLGVLPTVPCPTVAAITGYCLGGALELALGADRRVVGDNVKLGLPQLHHATVPTAGMEPLIRLVGLRAARDLVYSGRYVEAEEALRLGLVDEVVAPDDVYDAAHRWAAGFTGRSGAAVAAAKSVLATPERHSSHAMSAWIGLALTGEPQRAAAAYAADGPNPAPGTGR